MDMLPAWRKLLFDWKKKMCPEIFKVFLKYGTVDKLRPISTYLFVNLPWNCVLKSSNDIKIANQFCEIKHIFSNVCTKCVNKATF